jgi:tRNA-splicing ligase RtcB
MKLQKNGECRWLLPRSGAMLVPGEIFALPDMLSALDTDKVTGQVANVACLPGIIGAALAMPDAHWGYGFPIGGVAAMDAAEGVISPGGVGYDISCGVRLLACTLDAADIKKKLSEIADALYKAVPSGVGSETGNRLSENELRPVCEKGARWAVEKGFGEAADLECCEDEGATAQADASAPSARAYERGAAQLGTLGSGNHFIEVQEVSEIFDAKTAEVFGLHRGQAVVLVHTGSRGFGYQICDEYVRLMLTAARRYGISLPDRQLACAPVNSPEGKKYFGAMCAASNYARANRQMIAYAIRGAFRRVFGASAALAPVYDVSHNIAKMETHIVAGTPKKLCVHRKGATRAFAAGHPDLPARYKNTGHPVLVPGSMGTSSYVLVGTARAAEITFASVCHGAGRAMSRTKAAGCVDARDLRRELSGMCIEVRCASMRGLAEEAPCAYKDVSGVVETCRISGIAAKVARMKPLAVIKG